MLGLNGVIGYRDKTRILPIIIVSIMLQNPLIDETRKIPSCPIAHPCPKIFFYLKYNTF